MKRKLLYIGHSYHQKTKSTQFLIDYLNEFYDVDVVLDESWSSGVPFDYRVISSKYFAVVFFQLIPEKRIFEKIKHDNIIYFPMYDNSLNWNYPDWLPYQNIKIFNFSKTLHKKLSKWNFNSEYVQYFIEPEEFSAGAKDEIFFWQRLEDVDVNTIANIFKNENVKIHIHKAMDPGLQFTKPTEDIEKKFNITYSDWFDTKEQMQAVIKSKAFYVAPRKFEGIGMSFLEAMAMGKAVIANNQPTMNEYIENGVTGYLCDFKNPKAIKFENIANIDQVQKNAYEFMQRGYEKWLCERRKIIDFINSPNKKCETSFLKKMFYVLSSKKPLKLKLGKNPYLYVYGYPIVEKKG